jgi:NADH dehydrogenase
MAPVGRKHVLIVGAGFGGLTAAKALAHKHQVHVTLIDRRNHHLFQPLLYQVATAGLNPADIAVPIRAQFTGRGNVAIRLAAIDAIDLREKWVRDESGVRIGWDYLIIACGSQHSYFGHPEWEEFAPGLKTLEQAVEIRRRILFAFEAAENEPVPEKRAPLLTFVVVGGGPTGVELSGAIADVARTVLVRDFRQIDPASARVFLVEAGPRLLPAFPEKLASRAAHDLGELGVTIRTGAMVADIDATGVTIKGEPAERIPAHSVFWAAGVQADPLTKHAGVPLDRSGRVKVEPDCSIPGFPDAFVVGDAASLPGVPGLAPAAIQMGELTAKNIAAAIAGKPRAPFKYRDKGNMATIGKHRAIAQAGRFQLGGYLAWLAWLFVHILYLIGFRNRVAVLLEWTWSYVFSKRGARLITGRDWKLPRGS